MKKQWLKYVSAIALCTTLLSSSYAEETPSSCFNRCRWTSYELFKHVVGFESEPMSVMMKKLTPEDPELWDQYSDCVGNLLLANIYLGSDINTLTKAVYDLRFHDDMTLSCISSTVLLSLFNPNSYLANTEDKITELSMIAIAMDDAIDHYRWENKLDDLETPFLFWLTSLTTFNCIKPNNKVVIPLPSLNTLISTTTSMSDKTNLYCLASPHLFVPKNTDKTKWSLEDFAELTEALSTIHSDDFAKLLKQELGLVKEELSAD